MKISHNKTCLYGWYNKRVGDKIMRNFVISCTWTNLWWPVVKAWTMHLVSQQVAVIMSLN